VGQAIITIETDLNADISLAAVSAASTPEPAPAAAPTVEQPAQPHKPSVIAAAPKTRAAARELGLDLSAVKGTGGEGRVSEEDVRAAAGAVGRESAAPALRPLPDFARFGQIERKPMSNVRLATARHLAHAWATVPQVTQYDSADITDLEVLRKRYA
jgi:pyruvate dehydrogenase E2 component (dihydrolipoamide acetyltransferase)